MRVIILFAFLLVTRQIAVVDGSVLSRIVDVVTSDEVVAWVQNRVDRAHTESVPNGHIEEYVPRYMQRMEQRDQHQSLETDTYH